MTDEQSRAELLRNAMVQELRSEIRALKRTEKRAAAKAETFRQVLWQVENVHHDDPHGLMVALAAVYTTLVQVVISNGGFPKEQK